MDRFEQTGVWSSETFEDQEFLVPAALMFLAFQPVSWLLSNFDIGKSIDYLLVFAGLLLLSVAVKSASELKYIYENHPQNSDYCVQPVTHRHFMFVVHVFFAATFLVLARFDWEFGSLQFCVSLLIAAVVAIYLGLMAMYSLRDPSRGRFYRRFDCGWILAWSALLIIHITMYLDITLIRQVI